MGSIFDDAYDTGEVIEDFRKMDFDRAMKYLTEGFGTITIIYKQTKKQRIFIPIEFRDGVFIDSKGRVYNPEEVKDLEFYKYTRMRG